MRRFLIAMALLTAIFAAPASQAWVVAGAIYPGGWAGPTCCYYRPYYWYHYHSYYGYYRPYSWYNRPYYGYYYRPFGYYYYRPHYFRPWRYGYGW